MKIVETRSRLQSRVAFSPKIESTMDLVFFISFPSSSNFTYAVSPAQICTPLLNSNDMQTTRDFCGVIHKKIPPINLPPLFKAERNGFLFNNINVNRRYRKFLISGSESVNLNSIDRINSLIQENSFYNGVGP